MTPKERAVMQQALEALEELFHSNSTKVAVEKYNTAHTALREALDEPKVNWYEEAMRLGALNAKHVGELRKLEAEQAEQEPVAWNDLDEDELAHKLGWRIGDPLYMTIVGIGQEAIHHFKAQNTAPVRTKDLTDELQQKCSDWGTYWRAPDAHGVNLSIEQATELLRDALGVEVEIALPVRTKDLTDDEIIRLMRKFPTELSFNAARAVIAADRKKNK